MMKTYLRLNDFEEEISPCECTPEGWAAWLAGPDEAWGRDVAATDGETFEAVQTDVTWHLARVGNGVTFEPPIVMTGDPVFALSYGSGRGWDAEDVAFDLIGLAALLREGEPGGHWVAVLRDHAEVYIVIYRADPPRCEVEVAHG